MSEDTAANAAAEGAVGNGSHAHDPTAIHENLLPDNATSQERDLWKRENNEAMDATLLRSYNTSIARQEREEIRNPAMPPLKFEPNVTGREMLHHSVKAAQEWNDTPLSERRDIAAATRQIESMVAAAKSMGIEVKSAADLAALKGSLMGEGPQSAPNPEIEQSLSMFSKAVPGAKSHREAAENVASWVDHISKHGDMGVRNLVEQGLGVDPTRLLSPGDRAKIAAEFYGVPGHVLAEMAHAPPEHREMERMYADMSDYVAEHNIDQPTRDRMSKLLLSNKVKDGSNATMLREAHRQAMRYSSPKKASAIDATLRAVAAKMGARA
jgi:hypothetical protein